MSRYVELHCHSCFSFREGASTPLELVMQARLLGYPALALTDHDNLAGAMEFTQTAKAWDLRPIIGAEVTLVDHDRPPVGTQHAAPLWAPPSSLGFQPQVHTPVHLVLLAESQRGYANLSRLLSRANLASPRGEPCARFEWLAEHAEGLIALSGCRRGEVPRLVEAGEARAAREAAERYLAVFGRESFFIELQQNLVFEDQARNQGLVALARDLGLEVVATNNVHYHERARHRLHDVLTAVRHRLTLEEARPLLRANSEFYLKSAGQMQRLFDGLPAAVENTLRIAARCTGTPSPAPQSPGRRADGQTGNQRVEYLVAASIAPERINDGTDTYMASPVPERTPSSPDNVLPLTPSPAWSPSPCTACPELAEGERGKGGRSPNPVGRGAVGTQSFPGRTPLLHNPTPSSPRDVLPATPPPVCPPSPCGACPELAEGACPELAEGERGHGGEVDPVRSPGLVLMARPRAQRDAALHGFEAALSAQPAVGAQSFPARTPLQGALPSFLRHILPTPSELTPSPRAERGPGGEVGFDLKRDLSYVFPDYVAADGRSADEFLRDLCYAKARDWYGTPLPEVVEVRLCQELELVRQGKRAGFFLRLWEIMDYAHQHGLPARGRGSSVGSIVCFLLGLSGIDPMKYDLVVERFLNEDRLEEDVPDIDIDLGRVARDSMFRHIFDLYGTEHAAMVCTFIEYRYASAIRDVGKALALPQGEVDKVAKRMRSRFAGRLEQELGSLPEFAARLRFPIWRDFVELVEELRGMPRHLSQHSGGIIISTTRIDEQVPVEAAAMDGRFICQWDKDSVADAGFIKLDLLGYPSLDQLERGLRYVRERHGKAFRSEQIELSDPEVYEMIQRGDVLGIVQIQSRAQIQVLLRIKVRRIEDLIIQVALIRPGPIQGGAVHPYIARCLGQEPVTYDHPSLEPALKETKGVFVFQEQVIQAAMAIAGFTSGQAEQLRRAMSRKRSREAMEALRREFLEGAAARGIDAAIAATVYEKILAFASFGFPKSHAAAMAETAYRVAWLKRYYPVEFYCALLNEQPMGFYSPEVIANDARRHGIEVRGIDVNHSRAECTIEAADPSTSSGQAPSTSSGQAALRLGYRYLKGLGEAAWRRLEDERVNGPYRSLIDFWRRSRLGREAIENLVRAGAFAWTGLHERELLWQLGAFHQPLGAQLPLAFESKGAGGARGSESPLETAHAGEHGGCPPTSALYREAGVQGAQPTPALSPAAGPGGMGGVPPSPTSLWAGAEQRTAPVLSEAEGMRSKPGSRGEPLLPTHPDEEARAQLPHLREMTHKERILADLLLVGLAVRGRSMDLVADQLHEGITPSHRLEELRQGDKVTVAGLVAVRQSPETAKGFVFHTLEDHFGLMNVITRPALIKRYRWLIESAPALIVHGHIEREERSVNVIAERFEPLPVVMDTSPAPTSPRDKQTGKREQAQALEALPGAGLMHGWDGRFDRRPALPDLERRVHSFG